MKTWIKHIQAAILTITAIALIPAASAVGITPLRTHMLASPGNMLEGTLSITNTNSDVQEIVLKVNDFRVREDESMQFLTDVDPENEWSMQEWIELSENNVLLEPNEKRDLKFKVNIPANADSHSYYGAIFASSQAPGTANQGGFGVSTAVAHLILLEVAGDLHADLEMQDFEIMQSEIEDEARIETTVYNSGNTHAALKGTILVLNQDEEIVEELPFNLDKSNVIPTRNKTYTNKWNYKNYEPGTYVLSLKAIYDENTPIAAELLFVIEDDKQLSNLENNLEGKLSEEAKSPSAENKNLMITLMVGGALLILFILILLMRSKRRNLGIFMMLTMATGLLMTNTSAQSTLQIGVSVSVDGYSEVSLVGCWAETSPGNDDWDWNDTDGTTQILQPSDREVGASGGDPYGFYDVYGGDPYGNLLPLDNNAFAYSDCRFQMTANGYSSWDITLYGESFLHTNTVDSINDMSGYEFDYFNFVLDNENPSGTEYPSTDGEHGFFILATSDAINLNPAADTQANGGQVYTTSKTYDETGCPTAGRPCYHYIPDSEPAAHTIFDNGTANLIDETFDIRVAAGSDFSHPAGDYSMDITLTITPTP